jgi:AraC family transcriptional regulator
MNSAIVHTPLPAAQIWPFTGPAKRSNAVANVNSSLEAIAPGPLQVVYSSAATSCRGFLLEKHLCSPGERAKTKTERHVISLLSGPVARIEYADTGGVRKPFLQASGSLTIMPIGDVPGVRLHTSAEFTHCALDEEFTRGVLKEMEPRPNREPAFRADVQDTGMQRILDLLLYELEADAPTGRLYVESLVFALATRYLLLGSEHADWEAIQNERPGISALPQRILKRVRDKIEACIGTDTEAAEIEDSDIGLEALAIESGYSRAHFLRMFRVATGVTPHQYVLDVRLRRAQDLLRRNEPSLIDIAALCGFSSQSHMTTVFRKRLGITPGEFRRSNCRAGR